MWDNVASILLLTHHPARFDDVSNFLLFGSNCDLCSDENASKYFSVLPTRLEIIRLCYSVSNVDVVHSMYCVVRVRIPGSTIA